MSMDFRPPTPVMGSVFTATIRIANNGWADASNFLVDILLQRRGAACPGGGGTSLRVLQSSVNAGDVRILSERLQINAPGEYSICVVLDPDNRIRESDETNNAFQRDITVVLPLPPTPPWPWR